jgi:hypothetical protein
MRWHDFAVFHIKIETRIYLLDRSPSNRYSMVRGHQMTKWITTKFKNYNNKKKLFRYLATFDKMHFTEVNIVSIYLPPVKRSPIIGILLNGLPPSDWLPPPVILPAVSLAKPDIFHIVSCAKATDDGTNTTRRRPNAFIKVTCTIDLLFIVFRCRAPLLILSDLQINFDLDIPIIGGRNLEYGSLSSTEHKASETINTSRFYVLSLLILKG